MISLKQIILHEATRFDDLVQQGENIKQWRNHWFTNVQPQLRQAIFNWWKSGIVPDDQRDDITRTLDDLDEFMKAVLVQSHKLVRGSGVDDF